MYKFLKSLSLATLLSGLFACTPADNASDATNTDKPPSNITTLDPSKVGHFGYGTQASAEQIAGWDIDIRPDGTGLPPGSGSVEDGEWIYEEQCAECHGSFGEGVGRFPVIAGGVGTLRDSRPSKTVGSYWPYTSTLFDYIRRAMPFTQPESLSDDETYAVTAYVLYLNDIVEDDFELNQDNLASVTLANQVNFSPDPRPDTTNTRCMNDCRDANAIKILSETLPQNQEAESSKELPEVVEATNAQSVYEQACKLCHETGLAGAPMIGESDQWQARLERGVDSMVANAISGFTGETGVMPAKGGFGYLSDIEVQAAVNYMVESVQ